MNDELKHWGIKGMHWGIRRYQNPDGTLTEAGKKRYSNIENYAMMKAREEIWKQDKWKEKYKRPDYGSKKVQDEFEKDYSDLYKQKITEGIRMSDKKREAAVKKMFADAETQRLRALEIEDYIGTRGKTGAEYRKAIKDAAKFIDTYLDTMVLGKRPDGTIFTIDRNGNEVEAPRKPSKSPNNNQ